MSAFNVDPKRYAAFVKRFGTTIDAFSKMEADADGVSVPEPHATGISIQLPRELIQNIPVGIDYPIPTRKDDESIAAVDLFTLDRESLLAFVRVAESTQERLERAEWLIFALLGYTVEDYKAVTGG